MAKTPKVAKTKMHVRKPGSGAKAGHTYFGGGAPKLSDRKDVITLLPTQSEFFLNNHTENLMVGGYGSAKSFALCMKLIAEASKEGNFVLLTRKYFNTLRSTTLRMLIEPEGQRAPLLKPGSYDYNRQEGIITLYGGGGIIVKGCDDSFKIRSLNVGAAFIDEVSELSEQEYLEILMRCRLATGSQSVNSVTNPSHKGHWLYRRFVTDQNKNRNIIYSSSLDNPFLPERFVETLKGLTGSAYESKVLGRFQDLDKIVYPMFSDDNITNLDDFAKEKIKEWVVGLDWGYSNSTAILLAGIDGEGQIWIFEETYRNKMLNSQIKKHLESYKNLEPTIVIDPSAAEFRAYIESEGFSVCKANNSVDQGIARVQDRLALKNLKINYKCENLLREIRGYSRDDNGKIIKVDDHAADALRYIISHIDDRNIQAKNAPETTLTSDTFFV